MAARKTLRKKKTTTKSSLFRRYFFMFTLTWITEKELERVIENKDDEFRRKKNMEIQSGGEKMKRSGNQVKTAINTIFLCLTCKITHK